MSKLDDIEYTAEWLRLRIKDYPYKDLDARGLVGASEGLDLLVRAVRELSIERKAYQALFEAVDNDYKAIRDAHPEIYNAYDVVTLTPEPGSEVLELIVGGTK